jgi:hypothetical protein
VLLLLATVVTSVVILSIKISTSSCTTVNPLTAASPLTEVFDLAKIDRDAIAALGIEQLFKLC